MSWLYCVSVMPLKMELTLTSIYSVEELNKLIDEIFVKAPDQ